MKVPFGYDLVNGELVINEAEAKIIRYTFAKQNEYTDHPPKELVDRVLAIAQEKGEILTYEEAEERVSYSDVLAYISREINSNAEFAETLKKYKPEPLRGEFVETSNITSNPIISKEDWDKIQEKIKKEGKK